MAVRSIGWVGLKVADRAAAADFMASVLGLEQVRSSDSKGFTSFRLPSGQLIDLLGPASGEYALHDAPAVIGVEVDDLEQFRADMTARGVEFVTEVEGGPRSGYWCYFRGPEGILVQASARGDA